MSRDSLENAVSDLKKQLEQDASLPTEDKDSLNQLSNRVALMLSGADEHWEEDLMDELEKQVILYEESHPLVARVINQIMVTLNGMGL